MAREMKNSGVEWIGSIPKAWCVTRVKDISSISSGTYISKDEYYDNGEYPIIGSNGEIGKSNKANNNNPVVTTGRVGTIGTAHIVDDAWITDNTLIINPGSKVCIKYLSYLIPNIDFDLLSTGTAQPLITATKLGRQYIPLPSVEEQLEIVNLLDIECSRADSSIEKTKVSIEEYKKLKQAIITEAVTKGIRPNRKMKDSGSAWFGVIPADWQMKKLKYQFSICKDIAGEEGYQVLSITQHGIIPKNIESNEGQIANDYSNYQLVNIGDFAMNHMDLLTGWVDVSRYEGVTSPDYRVFKLIDSDNNSDRYYLYMMQMCYFNRIFYGLGQGVSGMGRWRLQTYKFQNFLIAIPSKEEQLEIADYLDRKCEAIDLLIERKEALLVELLSYKKSLIFEYVTGKRAVRI